MQIEQGEKAVLNLNFLACKCVDFVSWISLKDYENMWVFMIVISNYTTSLWFKERKGDKLVDQLHVEYSLITRVSLQLINQSFDYLIEKLVRAIHNSVYKIEVKKVRTEKLCLFNKRMKLAA